MLNVIIYDTYAVYRARVSHERLFRRVRAADICQNHRTRLVERGELFPLALSQVLVPNASSVTQIDVGDEQNAIK